MFSRLCEMHLETESDGEQDFLAAFANYNPGEALSMYNHMLDTLVYLPPTNPSFSNLFSVLCKR